MKLAGRTIVALLTAAAAAPGAIALRTDNSSSGKALRYPHLRYRTAHHLLTPRPVNSVGASAVAAKAASTNVPYCGLKGVDQTPWPSEQECTGGQASRIISGLEATPHEYPWQLGLLRVSSGSLYFTCGATLITPKTALTAAHCTAAVQKNPHAFQVLVGAHNVNDARDGVLVNISRIIQHPQYDPEIIGHDFSILILEDFPMPLGAGFACLPQTSRAPPLDAPCTTTGWGTTAEGGRLPNNLREAQIALNGWRECTEKYGTTSITKEMICGQGFCRSPALDGDVQDACQGDSGGPMVCMSHSEHPGSYFLEGVVSWGRGCGNASYPGVYSRVTEELGWIHSNLVGVNPPPPPRP